MERKKFLAVLDELRIACEEANEADMKNNEQVGVVYEILQYSELAHQIDIVHKIADFYNQNWQGNADFVHIPNFNQTLRNCMENPIIIARKKGTDEILGVSTIKYGENNKEEIDPYFPEEDAKYFSITGILVKKDNQDKGVGRKIYEIALKGLCNYERKHPGHRLMGVIDCRNKHSLMGLAKAVDKLNQSNYLEKGKELPLNIIGYYELRDKENNELVEAPTLVVEIGLEGQEPKTEIERSTLSYEDSAQGLFNSLVNTLKSQFRKYGINEPIIQEDNECGIVYFYSLKERSKCRVQNFRIESNGTEQGNDRIPVDNSEIYGFVGPVPSISVDEGR